MMNEYFASALLGLIQGLTEFLPVSSSGHLILSSSLMGFDSTRIKIFEVAIQFGSILAVVLLYRQRFLRLLVPNFGSGTTDAPHPFAGIRGLYLLFLTSLPARLVGLILHDYN